MRPFFMPDEWSGWETGYMRILIALIASVFLIGCSAEPPKNSVDGPTPAEADALNDAAEMLDQTESPPQLTNGSAAQASPRPQ
jgi:hypothetical protein